MKTKNLFVISFVILSSLFCITTPYAKEPHILFFQVGGSHPTPTVPAAEALLKRGAKVTYLMCNDPNTLKTRKKLSKIGVDVKLYDQEFPKLWEKWGKEEPSDDWGDWGKDLVDQPESVQRFEFKAQYLTAIYWKEFLTLTEEISPDVIFYDVIVSHWGKHVADKLNIPAFASWPAGFPAILKSPDVKESVKELFHHMYPPTEKRKGAAQELKKILGPDLSEDIDENFPFAFTGPHSATFFYTYPGLESYDGINGLSTEFVFVGSRGKDKPEEMTEQEKAIITECQLLRQQGKKVLFISMGGENPKPFTFFDSLGEAFGNSPINQGLNDDLIIALHPGAGMPNPSQGSKNNHDFVEVEKRLRELGHTNFIVKERFPLPNFFDVVDVFIGHGGMNSSMEALTSQKAPMILMPGFGDQPDVAKLFSEIGAAIEVPEELNIIKKGLDNHTEWSEFASNSEYRGTFVHWMKTTVRNILDQKDSPSHQVLQESINKKLEGAIGYEKMADMILEKAK